MISRHVEASKEWGTILSISTRLSPANFTPSEDIPFTSCNKTPPKMIPDSKVITFDPESAAQNSFTELPAGPKRTSAHDFLFAIKKVDHNAINKDDYKVTVSFPQDVSSFESLSRDIDRCLQILRRKVSNLEHRLDYRGAVRIIARAYQEFELDQDPKDARRKSKANSKARSKTRSKMTRQKSKAFRGVPAFVSAIQKHRSISQHDEKLIEEATKYGKRILQFEQLCREEKDCRKEIRCDPMRHVGKKDNCDIEGISVFAFLAPGLFSRLNYRGLLEVGKLLYVDRFSDVKQQGIEWTQHFHPAQRETQESEAISAFSLMSSIEGDNIGKNCCS
jgi:hypothetical protein